MKDSRKILYENLGTEELKAAIRLPYIVPEEYFDNFSASVLMRLTKEVPSLPQTRMADFDVPRGYFNDLANQILATVHLLESNTEGELSLIAPVLNTISKQLPYQNPENYFERIEIEQNLVEKESEDAPIISISKYKNWIRFAVAASIIGIMVAGAAIFSINKHSKDAYLSYKSYKNEDLNASIKKLSDDDLIKYLNNDYIASNSEMIILEDGVAPSVKQNVETVSDKDLEEYLQETTNKPRGKKRI